MEFFYIVLLQDGCWLADWNGDPGRTCVRCTARRFTTYDLAKKGLAGARRYRPMDRAHLQAIPVTEQWEITGQTTGGRRISRPCIGHQVARGAVSDLIAKGMRRLTVYRLEVMIALWDSSSGWSTPTPTQRRAGGGQ